MSAADPAARFVPRYFEIEQALRARIAELQPDDPLPSDAMLCREFNVSRMTARNAVAHLAQEGIVYRVPGRGTFVAKRPVHRRAGSLGAQAVREPGAGEPSRRTLSRSPAAATMTPVRPRTRADDRPR